MAITFNQDQVESFLQNHSISDTQRNFFLDLSFGSAAFHERLYSAGLERIITEDDLFNNRSDILKSYIDTVGAVAVENNTREWWATILASKNRLASNLLELLVQYVKCARVIKKGKYDLLLIVLSYSNLLYPLRRLAQDEGQRVLSLRNYPEIFYSMRILYLARNALLIKERVKNYVALSRGIIKKSFFLARQLSFTKKNFHINLIEVLEKAKKYTVVKTHVFNSSFDNRDQFQDVYFGRLPCFLNKIENVISLIHIHGDRELIMKKISENQKQIIIPHEYFLTYRDILLAAWKFLFWRIRVEKIYFNYLDVSHIIKEEIRQKRFFFKQYLFYDSVKHFVKAVKVEKFIYTYENIPWERMAILSLRKFSPDTRIIGYQHSVVPQSDTGVFISRNEIENVPLPDKILTVGAVTRNIIYRYGYINNNMVEAACALRYEYLYDRTPKERKRSGNILLVLDGAFRVYKIINYVVGQLWESNSYRLTIRPHPIMPVERIKHLIPYDLEGLNRITISEEAFVLDDLEKADMVIYWGSTVALEAIRLGIPLIRYRMKNLLSYDPLFEFNHFKWECSEGDSLIDIIEYIYELSDEEFSKRAQEAGKYMDRYFHPVNDSNLNKFV